MGNKKTKVLILAGGTGGHIFPALAIAKALQKQGHQIHWVGTKAGLEALIVPKESIPISFISIAGLRGKRLSSLLVAPFMLMLSLLQSLYIILTVRPTIVLGMGGFVAGPGGIAAWILRVPLVIHEQNAVACVTNKILGRFAMHIFEAFPNSFPNFKDKVLLTGNPLRAEFYT